MPDIYSCIPCFMGNHVRCLTTRTAVSVEPCICEVCDAEAKRGRVYVLSVTSSERTLLLQGLKLSTGSLYNELQVLITKLEGQVQLQNDKFKSTTSS